MPLINAMLSSQVINQKARASAKAAPTFPLQVCRCALRKAIKPGISYFSFVGMKRIVSFVLCEDALVTITDCFACTIVPMLISHLPFSLQCFRRCCIFLRQTNSLTSYHGILRHYHHHHQQPQQ